MLDVIAIGFILAIVAIVLSAAANRSRRRLPANATRIDGPGTFSVEVVGESHYLDNLRSIAGRGSVEHPCIATIRWEPGNAHDNNAMAVFVDGLQVGYLSRNHAARHQKKLAKLGTPHAIWAVDAKIFGGGARKPNLGVWLDFKVG